MLADFHASIDRIISEGGTITDFRKDFDRIVAENGWSNKGKRGWRTRVIFDTNLRTAHMAGRWAQIQRTKARRPFLQYLTVGDQRVRPEHRKWDAIVLPIDNQWWNTHYPPNGWGCRCTVRTLSERQLRREGLNVTSAPPLRPTERINTRTGEVYGDVPTGIDAGWDYNVGKAWLAPEAAFGETIALLPSQLRDAALLSLPEIIDRLHEPFSAWARNSLDAPNSTESTVITGYLNKAVFDFLDGKGITPETVAISIRDVELRQMRRDLKQRIGKNLEEEFLLSMPEKIANPDAILFDVRKPAILYVSSVDEEERRGMVVVKVNFRTKGEVSNAIRSGDFTPVINLRDGSKFEIIEGGL
jgi:SPP1 gp7 family putative phage head morphogenesis protein